MRATVAEIDLDAIAHNLNQVKERVKPAKVMAVVKANAYGHGAVPVAKRALKEGMEYLAVALVEEGIELRENGIEAPILVFGGFFPEQIPLFIKNNLELTLLSAQDLTDLKKSIENTGKNVKVHINVDTGMGRVGVPFDQAEELVKQTLENNRIELIGLYTHFATSDEKDKTYANLQLERFSNLINKLEEQRIHIPLKHAANSGAILDLPNAYFDMVRPGVMMYGYYPSTETTESLPLKPAMALKSRVIFLNDISPGTSVSYGRKFTATKETKIATIPLGYADGYNRLLTNVGFVSIRGNEYPVVGRVCMDQILVNVGLNSNIEIGDEVVLFSPDYGYKVSVRYICDKLQTIPYEVTCWMSNRVPRVFINT